MRNFLLLTVTALGLTLLTASPISAATTPIPTCQPIYGGGSYTCNGAKLSIDKTVQDVQSGSFVNNLGVNDAHYSPESTVIFKIQVKNNGSDTVKNISIKDTFPQYITYTSGEGKYDSTSKALTITLSSLEAGKTQNYELRGKVAKVTELPQDQTVICVVNQATAKTADQSVSDSAQFCIQRQSGSVTALPTPAVTKGGQIIYPVTTNTTIKKTPPTGPEALVFFALAPAGVLGSFLRRKAGK